MKCRQNYFIISIIKTYKDYVQLNMYFSYSLIPFLLEQKDITPDENFDASSTDLSWRPSEGRLNNKSSGIWCARAGDMNPWLSVKLVETAEVTRIAIQGSPKISVRLVKKFKISHSWDGVNWVVYQENGEDHVSNYC